MTPKFFSEIIEIIETAYRLKAEQTHKAKEQEKSKPNRTIKIRKNPHKGITPISIISITSVHENILTYQLLRNILFHFQCEAN